MFCDYRCPHVVMQNLVLLCLAPDAPILGRSRRPVGLCRGRQIGLWAPSPVFTSSYETYGNEASSPHTGPGRSLFALQHSDACRPSSQTRMAKRCRFGGGPRSPAPAIASIRPVRHVRVQREQGKRLLHPAMGTRGARLRPSPDVNFMWSCKIRRPGEAAAIRPMHPGWDASNHHCAVLRPGSAGLAYAQRTD